MAAQEADPGVIKIILSTVGSMFLVFFSAVTGWHFKRIARVEERIENCEDQIQTRVPRDEFYKKMDEIRSEMRQGFRGIHERMDRHLERER